MWAIIAKTKHKKHFIDELIINMDAIQLTDN